MNSESIYYTYLYRHPVTRIPFYVGYGKNKRYLSHLMKAKKDLTPKQGEHKLNTIRKLLINNESPIIEFVDTGLTKEIAIELEIFLISFIGTRFNNTGPLTNLTFGGDGGDTTNAENTLIGIRRAHENRTYKSYASYGMLGKKQSSKFLASIKEANSSPIRNGDLEYSSIGSAAILSGLSVKIIRKLLDDMTNNEWIRLTPKKYRPCTCCIVCHNEYSSGANFNKHKCI